MGDSLMMTCPLLFSSSSLMLFKLYNFQMSDRYDHDYGQHVPSDVNH